MENCTFVCRRSRFQLEKHHVSLAQPQTLWIQQEQEHVAQKYLFSRFRFCFSFMEGSNAAVVTKAGKDQNKTIETLWKSPKAGNLKDFPLQVTTIEEPPVLSVRRAGPAPTLDCPYSRAGENCYINIWRQKRLKVGQIWLLPANRMRAGLRWKVTGTLHLSIGGCHYFALCWPCA